MERPIVCGTDFSNVALEAAEVAGAMAQRFGTKLILVYVEQFHGNVEIDPSLFEALLSDKKALLEKEANRIRKLGVTVEPKLVSGSVFDELVTAATQIQARTLVVGAIGHGLARRLLVGSVAERTVETSPVPTLVVRPHARLASWLRGEHSLKVLVGYDFSAASDAALVWVNDLQKVGSCEIDVVHIDWPPDETERLGYHGPLSLNRNPSEIQNFLERDLAERVAIRIPPEEVKVRVEPGWGHPEGHLFEIAHREHPDLIVLGTHRRHGWNRLRFGSVSRTVLRHAEVSVAITPPLARRLKTVPKLDRILVATDFSDLANSAIPYGCAILEPGGTLKLLHVLEPVADTSREARPGKENPKLRVRLRALVPTDAADHMEIETEVVESDDPAAAIRQAAERFGASAICIGSHGRSGLAKTLLGSVAESLLAESRRPVFVIRDQAG